MKKLTLTLLLGMFLVGTWSCTQNATETTNSNDSIVNLDTTIVDSTIVDTLKVDTIK